MIIVGTRIDLELTDTKAHDWHCCFTFINKEDYKFLVFSLRVEFLTPEMVFLYHEVYMYSVGWTLNNIIAFSD